MSGIAFDIRFPDGRVERLVVDSDRVLIGSGAHCEIRLPSDLAAVEHVLVTSPGGGAGVTASARHLSPPPTLNGADFTQQVPLLADSVLGVGQVQIRASVVEITESANVIKKKAQASNPLIYLLAIVVVPASLYVLFDDGGADPLGGMPKDVPQLWTGEAAACSQSAPDQAMSVALDKKVAAEAKRERSPFHAPDGVAAVPLFEAAAACFKAAGDAESAAEMQGSAKRLRDQLSADYRARQLRLSHALSVKDLRTAQREARLLLSLLRGKEGAYVTWLGNLDRHLAVKLGRSLL